MGERESWSYQGASESQRPTHWGGEECKSAILGWLIWLFQYEWWTQIWALLLFLNVLLYVLYYVCIFFPECHPAGRKGSPEESAQTTGNSKLQPAGSDSGRAETDCIFTGEQHDTTDAERQVAGNPWHILHNIVSTGQWVTGFLWRLQVGDQYNFVSH